jgi:DNA-binding XRE family transcriptional regulator
VDSPFSFLSENESIIFSKLISQGVFGRTLHFSEERGFLRSMTPAQCRAARGLLNWNQDDLAKASGVSAVTVRNFENEKSAPQRASLQVIRAALEAAGVEFTNGEQPGVRLRKAARPT